VRRRMPGRFCVIRMTCTTLLIGLILFPEHALGRLPEEAPHWLDALVHDGRTFPLEINGRRYWAQQKRKA